MNDPQEPRLLIVDDEPQVRRMLETYFVDAGYDVTAVPDVPTALARLPEGFDVVLSDIKMPEIGGIEFLRHARQVAPKVGIFLITGYPTVETIIDAKQYGAAGYLRKPLKLVEVDSRLRAFLHGEAQ